MKKLFIVSGIVLLSISLGCNKKKVIHEEVDQPSPPSNVVNPETSEAGSPFNIIVGEENLKDDGVLLIKVNRQSNKAANGVLVTSGDSVPLNVEATTIDCNIFGKYTFQQNLKATDKLMIEIFDGSLNLRYWPNQINCQLLMSVSSTDGRQASVNQSIKLEFDSPAEEVVVIQSLKEESYKGLDGIALTFERHEFSNPAQFPVKYEFSPRGSAKAASVMFYDFPGTDHNCVFLNEYEMPMDLMEITINGVTKQVGPQNFSFTLQPGDKMRIDLIVHTPGIQPASGRNFPNVKCPGSEPKCVDITIPFPPSIRTVCTPMPEPVVSLWGFSVVSMGQKSRITRYYGERPENVEATGGGGSMPGPSGWGSQRCM